VTYLLPHVDPSGAVYTTLTNFNPKKGFCCISIFVDKSTDGGQTWVGGRDSGRQRDAAAADISQHHLPGWDREHVRPRDHLSRQGHYPLYVAYEDFSAGSTTCC
jgi:hypothetical protein